MWFTGISVAYRTIVMSTELRKTLLNCTVEFCNIFCKIVAGRKLGAKKCPCAV